MKYMPAARPAMRRGLTLIEMLVTLVIVSLLGAIVSQALSQSARIERLLEGNQLVSMSEAVRAEWVRDALVSLMPGDPASPDRFVGSPRELSGWTAQAPTVPVPGMARVRLRLVYQPRSDTTELRIDDASIARLGGDALGTVLLAWPGREGGFRYLDSKGEWRSEWASAPGSALPVLPAAIALDTGMAAVPMLIAATRVSPVRPLLRRELESM